MRQTDMDGVRPQATGRPEGRPVFVELPLRLEAQAADGARCRVVVEPGQILLERPVAGLACAIRLPASALDGVAAAFLPGGPAVRLVHREAGLTIDLVHPSSPGIAIELRDRLARALGLPALFVDAEGTVFGRRPPHGPRSCPAATAAARRPHRAEAPAALPDAARSRRRGGCAAPRRTRDHRPDVVPRVSFSGGA
jgi:hypothetical protein